VQRRHPVDARRIDVGLLGDERAHGSQVAARGRIDQWCRRLSSDGRRRQEERDEPRRGKKSPKHQRILSLLFDNIS
jgi:hypothetical protein